MNARRVLGIAALLAIVLSQGTQAAPAVEDSMAQRVLACTGCHGREGRAAPDGYYPRIAGKPAGYLYQQLLNFRDGRRQYLPMQRLLDPLSDDYLREMAEHFAALELPYAAARASGGTAQQLARGEALALHGDPARRIPACTACHGNALTGIAPSVPGLLGLPRDYLAAQIGAWKTGSRRARSPDCMAHVAALLTVDDVGAVSHWLASHPLPPDAKPPADTGMRWPMPCGGVSEAPK